MPAEPICNTAQTFVPISRAPRVSHPFLHLIRGQPLHTLDSLARTRYLASWLNFRAKGTLFGGTYQTLKFKVRLCFILHPLALHSCHITQPSLGAADINIAKPPSYVHQSERELSERYLTELIEKPANLRSLHHSEPQKAPSSEGISQSL